MKHLPVRIKSQNSDFDRCAFERCPNADASARRSAFDRIECLAKADDFEEEETLYEFYIDHANRLDV